jgi:autotransporter passenger strand-loop-strand repeat protein
MRGLIAIVTATISATAAQAAVPITGTQLQSNVGTTVLPDFQGGTLRIDQVNATDNNAYNVGNVVGNTIDEFGNTITFTNTFSGPGALTITDSGGGGNVIVTGFSVITGAVTINSGATLQWGNASLGVLIGSGGMVDNGAFIVNLGGGAVSTSLPLSGSGTLEVKSGTFGLGATNTFSGITTIDSGATLELGTGGATGTLAGAIHDNGLLKFDYSGTVTLPGTSSISGTGDVEIAGGTVIDAGADFITGTVTIDNGATLRWGNGTGGAFLAGSTMVDNGALVFDFGGGAVFTSNSISGTGTLTVHTGTFQTSGTDTYTGPTTVDSGATLELGGGGNTGTVTGNIVDNGTVKFDYGSSFAVTSTNSFSGTGNVEIAGGTMVLANPGVVSAVGGTVTIDSGATMQWGTGVGLGNALIGTGGVIDNGALVLDYATGNGVSGGLQVSGTGTMEIESGLLEESGAITIAGATTIDSGGTLQLDSGGTVTHAIVDNGTLKFNYSGAVTLGGTETISGTGNVEIMGGTLIDAGADFISGTVTIDNGATLQWGNGAAGAFLAGTTMVDNGALVFDFGGGAVFTSNSISGTGTLTVHTGTFQTTGTDTYTGPTTVDSGATLELGGGGNTGTVTGDIIDNGTVKFDYGSSFAVTSTNSFSGTGNVEIAGGTMVLANPGVISIVSGTVKIDSGATMQWGTGVGLGNALIGTGGVIDNGALVLDYAAGNGVTGGLQISGTGTLTIHSGLLEEGAATTYTGSTTIDSGGLLRLDVGGAISNSTDVVVNGTFDISNSAGTSITTLDGAGVVSVGSQTLTLTNASGNFAGVIQDGGFAGGTGGALTIAAGEETLSGTNTFTGPTTINPAAILVLGAGGTSGSVAGNIVDNGLVVFNYGGTVTEAGNFSGSGSAEVFAGTAAVTGIGFLGGTVTIDPGATLQWGDGSSAGFLAGTGGAIVDNGTLALNGTSIGTNAPI